MINKLYQIINNPCHRVYLLLFKTISSGMGGRDGVCDTISLYIAHETLVVGRWANVWLQFELCAHNIDFTARPVS